MRIGAYEIVQEVGRGGIGVVYRCRGPRGEDVALKILQRLDGERLQRFEREKRLLESLGEADGFVPLIESGDSPVGPYLVMPFLGGGTLRERLKRGTFSLMETVALGERLGRALGRAHALGIVHRDLKPDNVIFDAQNRPFILDLGLAKHYRKDIATRSVSLSKTGEALGTISYMAPEQADDAKTVGPAADVFSLGAILYECLSGVRAFDGETSVEVWAKVVAGQFEPLRAVCPDAPRWFVAIVTRALAATPAKRFHDGAALARALAARTAGEPVSKALVGGGALIAAALVAGGLALALARSPAPPPPPPPPPRPVPPSPPPRPASKRPIFETRHLRATRAWGSYAGRHAAMVQGVQFSPDGATLVSGGLDQAIHIWDASDLHELLFIKAGSVVRGVAFSPDGRRVFASLNDKTVRAWDATSGEPVFTLEGHDDEVYGLALSPDGKHALTAGRDHKIGYWDLETGELIRWLEGHTGLIYGIAVSPDGKRAVSGAADKTARVWDVETGKLIAMLAGHEDDVQQVAFSPDGESVATSCKDGFARVFDARTGALRHRFERHRYWCVCVAFSPDGERLVSGSFDQTMKIHRVATGATERTIETENWVLQASWSPDGRRLASAGNDGLVRLWDATTGAELAARPGHHGRISGLSLTPDGRVAATCGYDRAVRIWDAESGKEIKVVRGMTYNPDAVALSSDAKRVLVGGGRDKAQQVVGELSLADLEADRLVALAAHSLPVRAVAFSPSGKAAVSAAFSTVRHQGEAFAWTFGDEPTPTRVKGAAAGALAVVFGDPGRVIAGTVRGAELWDLEPGTVEPLGGDPRPVLALAHDGTVTLAGGTEGHLLGYDTGDPARSFALVPHKGMVVAIALAPDHRRAVTASDDGLVRLVSLNDGEIDSVDLASRGDVPTAAAFYPDGRSFLVATLRGVVLRFEVR